MIFKIDESILCLPKSQYLALANAIVSASRHSHYVMFDNFQVVRWLFKTILNSTDYIATLELEILTQNTEFLNPTKINQKHLQSVTIGVGNQFCDVYQMIKLAEDQRVVVVENELYDWSVIKKWINLYATHEHGYFQTINRAVNAAVGAARLVCHGAGGGNSTIKNTIMAVMPMYGELVAFELTTIFDSDKNSSTDCSHNTSLINFLTGHGLSWKELKRREIENYFPLSSYKKAHLIVNEGKISDLSSSEWNYVNFGKAEESGVQMQKSDVLRLADNLTYVELKDALDSSSCSMDEIQEIIIHLAKFI